MKRALVIFPAFKSKNYRYYFIGQLISLAGTWLQVVAEGWLVLTLTNSAFLIGIVAACATLPTLFFSLFGGVIIDRFSTKKILLVTQTAAMILAGIYGILTVLHVIDIWSIMLLAFLLGVVSAIDFPARQAFTIELVERDHLSSAIALNAGIFNAARIIGPGVAGVLIALFGPGGAFLVNSVTYIAAIISTYLIKTAAQKKSVHPHPIRAINEGLSYTFSHPTIRTLIILAAIISIFGWSYTTIMPYIAKNTLHANAATLGYLYAVAGIGALIATFLISALSKKISGTAFIVGGTLLYAVSIFGFTFAKSFLFALPFLFFSGIGLLSAFANINALVQHSVEDKFRGRVLSIYILSFIGLLPFGNFQIGFVSEYLGPENAIRIGAVIVFFAAAWFYFSSKKRNFHQDEYNKSRLQEIPEPILAQGEA